MIYLATPYERIPKKYHSYYGAMSSLAGRMEKKALAIGRPWMLDNGEFAGKFNADKWIKAMKNLQPYGHNCLGVVVPDVVGDAVATLEKWHAFKDVVQPGYKKCFVAQNGMKDIKIPWSEFDCLFIGGDNHFKLKESPKWIVEAQRRGKWVHVGRVNTPLRIRRFWYADSVDGTTISMSRLRQIENLTFAIAWCMARKQTRRLL